MKPPRFTRTICAMALLILGAIFVLLGELGVMGVPIPMRGGEAWMFLPWGIFLLLGGAVLALSVGWTIRFQTRLRAEGAAVPAEVIQLRYHPMVGYGADGVHKRHPWTVLCKYTWEGQTYTVRSSLLWSKPCAEGQKATVYVNQNTPKRAFLAPESLRFIL